MYNFFELYEYIILTREKPQGQFLYQNFGAEQMVITAVQKEIIAFQFLVDLDYTLHILQITALIDLMYM